MSELKLDRDTKVRIAEQVRKYLDDEFEAEIGSLEAEQLIDFLSKSLGACFYNLGVKDAQALTAQKMDDLNDAFYSLEKPEDPVR